MIIYSCWPTVWLVVSYDIRISRQKYPFDHLQILPFWDYLEGSFSHIVIFKNSKSVSEFNYIDYDILNIYTYINISRYLSRPSLIKINPSTSSFTLMVHQNKGASWKVWFLSGRSWARPTVGFRRCNLNYISINWRTKNKKNSINSDKKNKFIFFNSLKEESFIRYVYMLSMFLGERCGKGGFLFLTLHL